jgi:hypothetical protein
MEWLAGPADFVGGGRVSRKLGFEVAAESLEISGSSATCRTAQPPPDAEIGG